MFVTNCLGSNVSRKGESMIPRSVPSTVPSKSRSFAVLAQKADDEDIPYIRELLSYDMLCEHSCTFVRTEHERLIFYVAPSPLHWSRQCEWPWVLRNGEWEEDQIVVDVGSGWSVLKYALAQRVKIIWAIDNDPPSVVKAQETTTKFVQEGYIARGIVHHRMHDARNLPFESDSVDRVVCVSVLEHIEGKEGRFKALSEIKRVLRPNGITLLTFDVVVNGKSDNTNFYVNLGEAAEILGFFGISSSFPARAIGAYMEEGCGIVTLMVKYVKE